MHTRVPLFLPLFLLFLFFRGSLSQRPCPCQCFLVNPKRVNLCASAAAGCRIVRCAPRTDGFACCDGKTVPTPPDGGNEADVSPVPVAKVKRNIDVIDKSARRAVDDEPVLARQAADILFNCALAIGDLGEEFETVEGVAARFGIDRGGTQRQRRRRAKLSPVFKLFRMATKTVLLQIYSRLVLHLP